MCCDSMTDMEVITSRWHGLRCCVIRAGLHGMSSTIIQEDEEANRGKGENATLTHSPQFLALTVYSLPVKLALLHLVFVRLFLPCLKTCNNLPGDNLQGRPIVPILFLLLHRHTHFIEVYNWNKIPTFQLEVEGKRTLHLEKSNTQLTYQSEIQGFKYVYCYIQK